MLEGGLDHVGIAVSSIDALLPLYRDALKLRVLGEEVVESQGVRVLKLDAGGTHVELIEPLTPESNVGKFIEKKGEGIHHVCFDVPDVAAAIAHFKSLGFRTTSEAPMKGASGREVAFLHPRDSHGVLIEVSAPAGRNS